MREVIQKEWHELQAIWCQLYDSNTAASPFQSWDYLHRTGKGSASHREPFRLLGLKPLNLVLLRDGQPIAAAALLHKKENERHICYLRGHFTTANYLDIVYTPDFDAADFRTLMDEARRLLGNAEFQFDRIRDDSPTRLLMSAYFANGHIEQRECACISLAQSYEDWLQGLRKSARDSLTNRLNRLLTDRADWSVEVRSGCDVDMLSYKRAMSVCAERYLTKNALRLGPLSRLAARVLTSLLLRDKLSQWVKQSKHGLFALLRINGEVAAFASMVVCKDKCVSGVRFAIDHRFSRYSPGSLLLSQLIRHLTQARQCGALSVDQLDMGQGVDGGSSYKYAYGGETRYLYFFSD